MSADFDREIDRLLRGRADATRDARAHGNGRDASDADGSHLDVDELSAYAENALPAPTRLRFAAHLADCSRCRKIATGIALSSGVATELERSEAEASKTVESPSVSWRERLAALLSPRVLRFAAPALAICVVGAIAFVALRQSPRSLNDIANQTAMRGEAPNTSAPPEASTGTLDDAQDGSTLTSNTNLNANVDALRPADAKAAPASSPGLTTGTTAAPAAAAPAPVTTETFPVVPPAATGGGPTVVSKAADEASAPPPPARADASERKAAQEPEARPSKQEGAKDKAAEDDEAARVYSGAANTTNIQQSAPKVAGSQARRGVGGADDDSLAAQRRRNEVSRDTTQREVQQENYKAAPEPRRRPMRVGEQPATQGRAASEAAEETRSVGGRRFRRQGDVWIDTAYRPSHSVTTYTRGSERYRALVADEPDIDRIARQFSGELILVWKGRVYRIK